MGRWTFRTATSAERRPSLRWPVEWHEACEWNYDLGREHGFLAGLAAANRAMQHALDAAVEIPPGSGLTPLPKSAKDVIRRMVTGMEREAMSRRRVEAQQAFRTVVDHQGGPVPTWETDE